ncbi:MAG: hypothetical protein ABIY55_20265 [Kofleriaceae bacterium]
MTLLHESFFDADWKPWLDALAEPILVIGNPPWVTMLGLEDEFRRTCAPRSPHPPASSVEAGSPVDARAPGVARP